MITSVAPTRDLSAEDLSLLNVLHSEPTSMTLGKGSKVGAEPHVKYACAYLKRMRYLQSEGKL